MSEQARSWYPLDAAVSSPSSAKARDTAASRDDDLLTAWTCETTQHAGKNVCALSLRFEKEAEVGLIRLFGSLGATHAEQKGFARVKTIKVTTSAGSVRVGLRDVWSFQYIELDRAVATKELTIEVESVFPGSKSQKVGISELEVYGTAGRRREPLEIDPRDTIVRGSPHVGSKQMKTMFVVGVTRTWIEQIDGKGGVRRILRGTGILGEPGDRFLLVPIFTEYGCTYDTIDVSGDYVIVDRVRRAFYSAAALGGVGGAMWRDTSGRGYGATSPPDPTAEGAVLRWMDFGESKVDRREAHFAYEGDFRDEDVLERATKEGLALIVPDGQTDSLCTTVSFAKARSLLKDPALLPQGYRFLKALDRWRLCDLENGERMVLLDMHCSGSHGFLMNKSGVVSERLDGAAPTGTYDPADIRLKRTSNGTVLVETSSGVGVVVPGEGLKLLHPGAIFDLVRQPECECAAFTGRE